MLWRHLTISLPKKVREAVTEEVAFKLGLAD